MICPRCQIDISGSVCWQCADSIANPASPQPSEAQIARLLAEWSIGDGLPRLDAEQVRIVKILVDRFLVLATERGAL